MNEKANYIIQLAEGEIGSPYVFGAVGEECTPSARGRRQRTDHPTIKSACQVLTGKEQTCFGCKYEGRRMYDCRGFTWWLLKQVGIQISSTGATTQWNRTQDWARQGTIDGMPDLVCCVFTRSGTKMSHTGMHIGGGVVIDCSTGVTRKTIKGFTHYAIPLGLYTEEEIGRAEAVTVTTYRRGMSGPGVSALQALLTQAGYPCEPTGTYDEVTIQQVKNFQRSHSLTVDGVAGPLTQEALKKALAVEPEDEDDAAPDTPAQSPASGLADVRVWRVNDDSIAIQIGDYSIRGIPNAIAEALMERLPDAFSGEV